MIRQGRSTWRDGREILPPTTPCERETLDPPPLSIATGVVNNRKTHPRTNPRRRQRTNSNATRDVTRQSQLRMRLEYTYVCIQYVRMYKAPDANIDHHRRETFHNFSIITRLKNASLTYTGAYVRRSILPWDSLPLGLYSTWVNLPTTD